jgi:hypothetical protein
LITEQSEILFDEVSFSRRLPNDTEVSISQLYNQTNLRSPNNSPSPVKSKPECKFKEMEVAVQMMTKLVSFFNFHLKMSAKDILS